MCVLLCAHAKLFSHDDTRAPAVHSYCGCNNTNVTKRGAPHHRAGDDGRV